MYYQYSDGLSQATVIRTRDRRERLPVTRWVKVIAIIQVLAGLYFAVLAAFYLLGSSESDQLISGIVYCAIGITICYSGAYLSVGRPRGYYMTIAILALQLIWVFDTTIIYSFFSGVRVGIRLTSWYPAVQFDIGGAINLLFNERVEHSGGGFNFFAFGAMMYLWKLGTRARPSDLYERPAESDDSFL